MTDTDQIMQLIFLMLLAVLIGGGVLAHYRGRLAGAIRDLLVWGVIITALALAYTAGLGPR